MSNTEAQFQSIVKGSGFVFIGQMVSFAAAFLYQLVLARYLGAEMFGVLSLSIVIMSFGTVLVKFGLPASMNRFIAFFVAKKNPAKIKGTIYAGLKIFLFSSVLVCVILFITKNYLLTNFYHSTDYSMVLILFILCIPFASFINLLYETFIGFKRPIIAVITESLLYRVSLFIFSIVVILFGYKLFGVGFAYLITTLLGSIIGLFFLIKVLPKTKNVIYDYKGLLNYSFPLFFASTLGLIFGWIDSLMIGYFLEPSQVGIYRVAFGMGVFLNIFMLSFSSFFFPVITTYFAKKKFGLLRKTYCSVSRLIVLLTLPIAFVFAFFSKDILQLTFGSEFISGNYVLSVLSIAYLLSVAVGPAQRVLQSCGETRYLFKIQAINVVINIVLNLFLIPIWGITGAALTTMISMLLNAGLFWWKSQKLFNLYLDLKTYTKYGIAGLISICFVFLLSYFSPIKNLIFFAILGIVFIGLYGLLLSLFKAFDSTDKNLFKAVLTKIRLDRELVLRMVNKL